jgi:NADPH:quinone reductase-like Zn-dependent oxidoreductase
LTIWAQPDSARLEELGSQVARGLFSIPIGKRLRLSQIREAQQFAEKGGVGKIVLTP